MTPRRGCERGSATIFATACLGLLLFVGTALGVAVALVVAHRRGQSAADLAALAGATAAQRGGEPCAAAARVALADGARMRRCVVDGSSVTVRVVVPGPHWLGQRADLSADARAGTGADPGADPGALEPTMGPAPSTSAQS